MGVMIPPLLSGRLLSSRPAIGTRISTWPSQYSATPDVLSGPAPARPAAYPTDETKTPTMTISVMTLTGIRDSGDACGACEARLGLRTAARDPSDPSIATTPREPP